MAESITTLGLGFFISILGIINMTGNISSLHWYHRQRVTEENIKPYGRLIGLGTLIIGISLIAFGILYLVFEKTHNDLFLTIGTVELIVGVVIGLVISVFAMIKYNKGIF